MNIDLSKRLNLIQGDCLAVLKSIPNNSIDLVVTSPPYNIGIDYEVYKDNLEWNKYFEWCKEWLIELKRIIKNDGRICINHYLSLGNSKERVSPLMELNTIAKEIGLKHHSVAVWFDRTLAKRTAWGSWLNASAPYINSPNEGILFLYKNNWKKDNKGISTINKELFIKLTRGIWEIPTDRKRLTKATFPEELPFNCIQLLSYKNDIVLDCFLGSGTTGKVAIENNRRFIGIELNKNYFNIASKRINERVGEQK
jgi:site-specific DNA-methyltransferase (adenine-specific)